MKIIHQEIKKCSQCPFCNELDLTSEGNSVVNGFYCEKIKGGKAIVLESNMKKPFENYRIPKWCPLEDKN